MFYKFHTKSPWLKRVLVPFWAFQLSFMLSFISIFIWLRAYRGSEVTNFVILITSAICTIVAVVEIILFAATRLDPLTNLILQLAKAITWLVLFVQVATETTPVQNEMQTEDKQGYSLGSISEFFYLQWFAEPLVLFITFLGALIYASVVYHRHRRARSRFLRSMQGKDLFPVITDDVADPVNSHQSLGVLSNSVKEIGTGAEETYPAEIKEKEAVEMTVLSELSGRWEEYELPATRSVRSSRGARSVRSGKGYNK